jgi:hypothetical protein
MDAFRSAPRRWLRRAALVTALCLTILSWGVATAYGLAANPTVATMIGGVNQSELQTTVSELSGALPAIIGSQPVTILTRYCQGTLGGDQAEQYIIEHLVGYGYTPTYDTFTSKGVTYRNIVAQITGTTHPSEIVVIGPHLDSYSGSQSATLAPGADDDASGVAATLYMAKVFKTHTWDRTIRFVFFDAEEIGMVGSDHYAAACKAAGQNIVAMLGPDMIGYNAGSQILGLHTRKKTAAGFAADKAIAQLCIDVKTTYAIAGIVPTIVSDGNTKSDHGSFWKNGYPAIMVIEDFNQYSPPNHKTTDTISWFVWSYMLGASRDLLGAGAHEAGLIN